MSNVIGYTRKELILLMLDNGIHCSVDKFEEVAITIQRAAFVGTGLAVEMRVITSSGEPVAPVAHSAPDAKI